MPSVTGGACTVCGEAVSPYVVLQVEGEDACSHGCADVLARRSGKLEPAPCGCPACDAMLEAHVNCYECLVCETNWSIPFVVSFAKKVAKGESREYAMAYARQWGRYEYERAKKEAV